MSATTVTLGKVLGFLICKMGGGAPNSPPHPDSPEYWSVREVSWGKQDSVISRDGGQKHFLEGRFPRRPCFPAEARGGRDLRGFCHAMPAPHRRGSSDCTVRVGHSFCRDLSCAGARSHTRWPPPLLGVSGFQNLLLPQVILICPPGSLPPSHSLS